MAQVGKLIKETMLKELTEQLEQQPNFFLATIRSLPADEADGFRQQLHAGQSRLVVTKRRLGQRAVTSLNIAGLSELLQGSVGIVFSGEDVVATAKRLIEFQKAHEEQIALCGGVVEGQLLTLKRLKELAELPARPVLLAQVVGVIEAPIAQLIGTVEQLIGDVAYCLEQLAAQKPAEAASRPAPDKPEDAPPAEASPPQQQEGTPA